MIENFIFNNTINEYFLEQRLKDESYLTKKNHLNELLPYHKQIKNKELLKIVLLKAINNNYISDISDDLFDMISEIYNKNINLDEFDEYQLNSIFSFLKKDLHQSIKVKASIDYFKQIYLRNTIPIWFFIRYEEYQKHLLECHQLGMLIDSELSTDEFNIFINLDFLSPTEKNEILITNNIILNKCDQLTIRKSIDDKKILFDEDLILLLNQSNIDINFIFDEKMIDINDLSFRSKTLIIGNPFLEKDVLFTIIKDFTDINQPWNYPVLNTDLIALSTCLILDIKSLIKDHEPYSYKIMKYLACLNIEPIIYDQELKQCNDIKKAILNVSNLSTVYDSIHMFYDKPVFHQVYQILQEHKNQISLDQDIDLV